MPVRTVRHHAKWVKSPSEPASTPITGPDAGVYATQMEVELQYLYAGAGPAVVPTELAGLTLTTSQNVAIMDTYFDTEALGLRGAGCSLRIRMSDREPGAQLTWKGPARRLGRSAKERLEVNIPVDSVVEESGELERLLTDHGLLESVCGAADIAADAELHAIGTLRNNRSTHEYAQGLHRLELSWDRLEYPVGPSETRLEVEVKSEFAERFLDTVDEQLQELFGSALTPPERGKVRELCERLYPELLAA